MVSSVSLFLKWGLFGLLLGAPCCAPDQERDYDYARHVAAQHPPNTSLIGAGLRLGMPQHQATCHLDSLLVAHALVWRLPTRFLPMRPYPTYQGGRLIGLQLVLDGDGQRNGPQCQALQGQLQRAHGGLCYEHDPGRNDSTWTWFLGGTEISLSNVVGQGFQLTYTDVYHEAANEQAWVRKY